jgi:hypothetical protein
VHGAPTPINVVVVIVLVVTPGKAEQSDYLKRQHTRRRDANTLTVDDPRQVSVWPRQLLAFNDITQNLSNE